MAIPARIQESWSGARWDGAPVWHTQDSGFHPHTTEINEQNQLEFLVGTGGREAGGRLEEGGREREEDPEELTQEVQICSFLNCR